jgi:hypothetical protein
MMEIRICVNLLLMEDYFEGGLILRLHFDCSDLVGDLITGYAPHNLDYYFNNSTYRYYKINLRSSAYGSGR